jgi:hypothetical protein
VQTAYSFSCSAVSSWAVAIYDFRWLPPEHKSGSVRPLSDVTDVEADRRGLSSRANFTLDRSIPYGTVRDQLRSLSPGTLKNTNPLLSRQSADL